MHTPFVQRWIDHGEVAPFPFKSACETLERLAQLVADAEAGEDRREAWRCSYTGASGGEVGVQWYEEAKQRDAYLEVMPIKGNPVAVRYVAAPKPPEQP